MELIDSIIKGLQEKKGRYITVADLKGIDDAICKAFVVCTGNSPIQIQALAQSVGEVARKEAGQRPMAVAGMRNAQWVAMDYSDVMVHIFLPEAREFYDLEHLWADADLTEIPNLD